VYTTCTACACTCACTYACTYASGVTPRVICAVCSAAAAVAAAAVAAAAAALAFCSLAFCSLAFCHLMMCLPAALVAACISPPLSRRLYRLSALQLPPLPPPLPPRYRCRHDASPRGARLPSCWGGSSEGMGPMCWGRRGVGQPCPCTDQYATPVSAPGPPLRSAIRCAHRRHRRRRLWSIARRAPAHGRPVPPPCSSGLVLRPRPPPSSSAPVLRPRPSQSNVTWGGPRPSLTDNVRGRRARRGGGGGRGRGGREPSSRASLEPAE